MLRTAWYATVAALAVVLPAHAQTEAQPPGEYALINARIVVAPGRVIERGTVRISNGRIVAVGDRVSLPEGVIRLDQAGRTVYPGLIDAATTTGLPRVAPQQAGGTGGVGPPVAPPQAREAQGGRPAIPLETRPDQLAADVFAPSDADLEAFRAAGVTTLGLAFESSGIFPGQTAAVSTGAGDPASLVLRTPVSLQVTFGRRRGGYPGTLMGTTAYIKQAFFDAEHERRVVDAFQRNAAAAPRPEYDPQARALGPAATGALPVWLFGAAERDLHRAVDLARELRIQNYVLVGAQEGYRAVDLLRSAGRPVVVSLDFPQPGSVTGRAFELHVAPISGEDTEGATADSAVARQLRGNAAALTAAGVPIALASYGLGRPADFRDRIMAAVEAGLSPDDALRALTVTPARILGLENAIGTIENGKLANIVVVEGDLFSRQGRVREVFVEGRRFEVRPQERAARSADGAAAGSAAGEWTGSLELPNGTVPFTLTLTVEGTTVTGQLATAMGNTALRGELSAADLVLRGTSTLPGMDASSIVITARVTGDELSGTFAAQGMADMPFHARRRAPETDLDGANHGGGE